MLNSSKNHDYEKSTNELYEGKQSGMAIQV